MSEQINLLALVRQHLLNRNEDYQWITMGPKAEKIGLAYLPIDTLGMPATFMFTELQDPASLVFDVHFGSRIAPEDQQELSILLLTLNANLPEGQLLLDTEGGYVYYRLKYVVPTTPVGSTELLAQIDHMEKVGVSMTQTYAQIIAQEFPLNPYHF